MGKSKKKLPPRVQRMKRQGRLQSAKSWIPTYTGKNLLQGYCNHYGVDWRCAAIELRQLGVAIDPTYLAQRERMDAETIKQRQAKKQKRESSKDQHWHPYPDAFSAYLAGDFAAVHDLEMKERLGDDLGSDDLDSRLWY